LIGHFWVHSHVLGYDKARRRIWCSENESQFSVTRVTKEMDKGQDKEEIEERREWHELRKKI